MFSKEKKPFLVYMGEPHEGNRWTILRAGLFGAFCGVCLATVYYMLSVVVGGN